MKKLFPVLAALVLAGATPALAQGSQTQQKTVISVTLTVETQTIRTGPYARFAQKFLGVIAPLSDKKISTVTEAAISWRQAEAESQVSNGLAPQTELVSGPVALSHTRNELDFTRVPVDRKDFTERSLEDAAREAATTLFTLRKHRIELITGMAGENVFGAGLPAALDRLDRLEEEYLALFMGKQFTQSAIKTYTVTPEKGEASRVVCRFSPADGLLPDNDLSGSPIVLDMKAAPAPATPAVPAKPVKNAPPTVSQFFPATVSCRVLEGKNELAAASVPVYQMGYTIQIPADAR